MAKKTWNYLMIFMVGVSFAPFKWLINNIIGFKYS